MQITQEQYEIMKQRAEAYGFKIKKKEEVNAQTEKIIEFSDEEISMLYTILVGFSWKNSAQIKGYNLYSINSFSGEVAA